MYVVKIINDDGKVYNNFYFNSKDGMETVYKHCNKTIDKNLFDVIKTEIHPIDVESAVEIINAFNKEVNELVYS